MGSSGALSIDNNNLKKIILEKIILNRIIYYFSVSHRRLEESVKRELRIISSMID